MKTLYKVLENGKLANYGNIGNDVAKVIDSKDLNHDLWIVEENGTIQVWKRPQSNKLSQGIIRCEMVNEKKGTIKATGDTIQICVMAFDLYTVAFEPDTTSVKTKGENKMMKYSVSVVDGETRVVWEGEYDNYPAAYSRYKDECRRSGYEVLLHRYIPESDSWEILHDRPQSYFEN